MHEIVLHELGAKHKSYANLLGLMTIVLETHASIYNVLGDQTTGLSKGSCPTWSVYSFGFEAKPM